MDAGGSALRLRRSSTKSRLGRDRDRRERGGAGPARRALVGRLRRRARDGRQRPSSGRHRGGRRRRRGHERRQHEHRRQPGRPEAVRGSSARSCASSTRRAPSSTRRCGLRTVSPTSTAIEVLTEAVRSCAVKPLRAPRPRPDVRPRRRRRQGRLERRAHCCCRIGHEVTIIEQRRDRFAAPRGGVRARSDASATRPRSSCSSAPGSRGRRTSSSRSPATTRTTSSSARSRESSYGVAEGDRAASTTRATSRTSTCSGSRRRCRATHDDHGPDRARGARARARSTCSSCATRTSRSSRCRSTKSSPSAGKRISGLELPSGARLISVMREGHAEIPDSETELQVRRPGARDPRAGQRGRAPAGSAKE